MGRERLHADEREIDVALMRGLLREQFPVHAKLPIRRLESTGTDNVIFRIGEELAARLPRRDRCAPTLLKEMKWVPRLAPHLPLEVPALVAEGLPAEQFPLPWGIYRWLDGRPLGSAADHDLGDAAIRLAAFLKALASLGSASDPKLDPAAGPALGEHNSGRGSPLLTRDAETRQAISAVEELGWVDARQATRVWEEALAAPSWPGSPRWIHGDLTPGNLLAADGRLSAVIDFGCLGVGDPACDLMSAWSYFDDEDRRRFRQAVDADDALWSRGRGWALSWAVIYIPYYHRTNPAGARAARRALDRVLSED